MSFNTAYVYPDGHTCFVTCGLAMWTHVAPMVGHPPGAFPRGTHGALMDLMAP